MTADPDSNLVDLTESNFSDVVSREGILLVECWSSSCGGCKLLGPIFSKVAKKHSRHSFAKLDTLAEEGLTSSLEVLHTPTLILYRDGILLFKQAGNFSEERLEDILSQAENLDMSAVRADIEAANAPAAASEG
jgi:thioredoxin 1